MGGKEQEKLVLQWHPAFYADIQVEFREDADKLIFENEHQLGTKPKAIDVLIIKKNSETMLRTNLGRIFRRSNIIEYKAPGESLTIEDYFYVLGYTYFYLAETFSEKESEESNVSLSFFCFHHPYKVMRYLEEHKQYRVRREEDGIYYVYGESIPVQIVVTRELTSEKNFWMKNLTNELQSRQEVLDIFHRYAPNQNNELYRSILDIIVKANGERVGEDKMLYDTLEELLAERIQKREERMKEWGEKCGENLFASLTSHLLDDNRFQELRKATEDVDYRKLLYREYGLAPVVAEDPAEYIVDVKPSDSNE